MNSEKISINKVNNKVKEKTNIKCVYFNNAKQLYKKICKIGNELNMKLKYSFLKSFAFKNTFHMRFCGFKIIIYYLIILLLPKISLSMKITSELRTLNLDQEITIKIRKGEQKIINDNFNPFPDGILLNEEDITQTYRNNGKALNIQGNDNTIKLRWNTKLLSCKSMFERLDNIISIDLSKFDLSLILITASMFYKCNSLQYINFGNQNTSFLKEMQFMFGGCFSLISINLSSLNTKKVINMGGAFKDCTSLISLNLSSFDTSQVQDFSYMFSNCSSLQYLDIHTFNTSSASNMLLMFNYCTSLKSLDLSHFNTFNITNMESMFDNCQNLISLNLNNFNTKKVVNMNKMFNNCTSLISLDLRSFDISLVANAENIFNNCNSLLYINLISFEEKYNYDSLFEKISSDLVYCIDETKSPTISYEFKSKGLTNNCSDICFLDTKKINIEERKCIFYCEKSQICKYKNKNICCDRCPEGTKPKNNICKEEELTEIIDSNIEKIESFNCTSEMFLKNICGAHNFSEQDNIINNIKNDIETHKIDNLLSNVTNSTGKNNDIIIKERGTTYHITSSNNQNNENYEDLSTIKLGECEDKLKTKYQIDKNQSLIIFKIEHNIPGILIPIISYEIYHPLNKTKLELDECKNILVNLEIPVDINSDDLIKYNPDSEYYTDECFPYTTENGTDIIINDRIDEYNNNNMSLCEKNCEFNGYEENTKKAQCKCETKSKVDNISEISKSNDLLLESNFEKENSKLNIVTMKCTYTLFSKNGIAKNIANYILSFIIILILICSILFYKCGLHIFETYIKEILSLKNQSGGSSKRIKKYVIKKKKKSKSSKNVLHSNSFNKKKKSKSSKNVLHSNPFKKKKKVNKHIEILKTSISKLNSKSELKSSCELKNSKKYILTEKSKKEKLITFQVKVKSNLKNEELTVYELNTLSYKKALQFDKRTFFEYYISLIKTNNIFIFEFCPMNDYNIRIIKICLFFIFFVIHYTLNTFFFTKELIHKIYEDGGKYNLSFAFPIIICSFFISYFLCSLIKYVSLSEKFILEIKRQPTYEKAVDKAESVRRMFIIKNICFFALTFIFLFLFWYYLSSFCAVFQNSQVYLIKNVIISFSLSLLFPFLLYIIPSILRIISLKLKKSEIIYKVSKIIQFI